MLRSGWTFPTTSTALLMVRWESCIHMHARQTLGRSLHQERRKRRRRRRRRGGWKKQETYAIEVDGDGSVRFDRCCFATQRHDLADDADGLVGESLKIWCVNPRGSFRGCHFFFDSVFKTHRVAITEVGWRKNVERTRGKFGKGTS